MKKPIYKWIGDYWGFIYNNKLFDKEANYKGWVDNNQDVWSKEGKYLGEIVEENYILRRKSKVEPISKIPKIKPIKPIRPIAKINRIGKISKIGWIDVLENI